jgi:hypothetical protein
MKKWPRFVTLALLAGVLTLALATARALASGAAEMQHSDRAFNQGDLELATLHARRAATSYVPGAPHVQAAYDRLAAIAQGSEAAGQPQMAVQAWRAVRGAALETRHVSTPRAAELERANDNLARLQAQQVATGAPPSRAALRARYARAHAGLSAEQGAGAAWVVAQLLGFALAMAGLGWFAARGISRDGQIAFGAGRFGLLLAALGVVCWTVGVWQA